MTETNSKMEQNDGLYAPGIVVAGVVSEVGTFVAIVALQALYLSMSAAQQREAAQNTINTSESLIAEQQARLNQYGWIDREQDVVAIPIEEAIKLTAAELRGTAAPAGMSGSSEEERPEQPEQSDSPSRSQADRKAAGKRTDSAPATGGPA